MELTRKAVAALPPDHRRVIELYDLEGKSIQEVAEEMGRTQGAIWMLRSRALRHLGKHLGDEAGPTR